MKQAFCDALCNPMVKKGCVALRNSSVKCLAYTMTVILRCVAKKASVACGSPIVKTASVAVQQHAEKEALSAA